MEYVVIQSIGPFVEYAVFGFLIVMSIIAVAITLERWRFYRVTQATRYTSRARLESDLTRRLNIIGTIGANAPYIGLLGTVLGIMVTFQTLGSGAQMDVKSIMVGLSLALKATAAGIAVAIPCVVLNNILRRKAREHLAIFDEAHGA